MPTKAEWEGMGRKVDMAEGDYIRKTPAGQLIAKEAFNEAIEAAAVRAEQLKAYSGYVKDVAAAIRKLKKP